MSHLERETLREESERMAQKRFFGMVLMAAGGLLALLCGLCTAVLSVGFIVSTFQSGRTNQLSFLMIPLIVGGVPTAAGMTLFGIGLTMYRDGRKRRGHPERVFD